MPIKCFEQRHHSAGGFRFAAVDFIAEIDSADYLAVVGSIAQQINAAISADRTTGGGN